MRNPKNASRILFLALMGMASVRPVQAQVEKTFQWPGSARAAVCMTYDDAIDNHLDNAAPDLESVGLRGTFYVQGASSSLASRIEDWRAMAARGHELGNHSLFHPCIRQRADGTEYDWLLPEYDMGLYSVRQMIAGIRLCNTLLTAVDGHTRRTYGAPCGDSEAGGVSYLDSLPKLFTALRISGGKAPDNMRSVELGGVTVPLQSATGMDLQQLIEIVEDAAAKGTIAVLCFHGVGGGHSINTTREVHRGLIEYLNEHRDRLWTDTFINVTDHIRSERKRLGWD